MVDENIGLENGGGGGGGEGDLGGLEVERESGASIGGSSTTVVCECEGVWLREETWVMVGEAATGGGV